MRPAHAPATTHAGTHAAAGAEEGAMDMVPVASTHPNAIIHHYTDAFAYTGDNHMTHGHYMDPIYDDELDIDRAEAITKLLAAAGMAWVYLLVSG